jgi:hypothetical protein
VFVIDDPFWFEETYCPITVAGISFGEFYYLSKVKDVLFFCCLITPHKLTLFICDSITIATSLELCSGFKQFGSCYRENNHSLRCF